MSYENEFFVPDVEFTERAPRARTLLGECPDWKFPSWLVHWALAHVVATTLQLSIVPMAVTDLRFAPGPAGLSQAAVVPLQSAPDPDVVYGEPQDVDGLAKLLLRGQPVDSVDHLLEFL